MPLKWDLPPPSKRRAKPKRNPVQSIALGDGWTLFESKAAALGQTDARAVARAVRAGLRERAEAERDERRLRELLDRQAEGTRRPTRLLLADGLHTWLRASFHLREARLRADELRAAGAASTVAKARPATMQWFFCSTYDLCTKVAFVQWLRRGGKHDAAAVAGGPGRIVGGRLLENLEAPAAIAETITSASCGCIGTIIIPGGSAYTYGWPASACGS